MKVILHEVTKTFNDAALPLLALRPINLTVASGEFVCIIGPSGCGKSTLLRLIADQIAPTSGEIRLRGDAPGAVRARKQIAWMAQNPALLPWKTVLENVQLPRCVNLRHQPPAPTPEKLLQMVGLADFAGAYPWTLSGGMQQRVALARMLATGASLWLMDEPFAALDELTRETLTNDLLRLWSTFHPTVLWVTHNIAEAVRLADHVVVMTPRPGRILATVRVTQKRPRDDTAPEAIAIVRRLRDLLRGRIRVQPHGVLYGA